MDLKFIKTTKCPTCGCSIVVSESVETEYVSKNIRRHCNGGLWENRVFACGYSIGYTPNFGKEENKSLCSKDKKYILIKEVKDISSFIKDSVDFYWVINKFSKKDLIEIKKNLLLVKNAVKKSELEDYADK